MNLYQETVVAIVESGHSESDIKAVIDDYTKQRMSVPCFLMIANAINYYDGYGATEINEHLKIIFTDDSWLERREYDGSEWWEFVNPYINLDEYEMVAQFEIKYPNGG